MERTKKSLTELERWIVTASHIGKLIPNCTHLNDYAANWSNFSNSGSETLSEIRRAIRRAIRDWLISTPNNKITETVKRMNPSAKLHLVNLMPIEYRGFFEYQGGQFPIQLSCPIPFFPCEKNLGTIHISKPIILSRGETTIKVRNILCKPDDLKTWVALNQIRKRNVCQVTEEGRAIIIHPSFTDIARELGYNNPSAEVIHKTIRSRMARLRDMGLTWENGKKWYDSSLLHLTTNLDEDSELNLEIHLDKFFLEMMIPQYNGVDEQILYKLSGKQVNLFIFLRYDKGFRKYGVYNSKDYTGFYWDVYKHSSLRSPLSEPITHYEMKKDLISMLDDLLEQKIIFEYSFKDNYLHISKSDEFIENENNTEPVKGNEMESKNICPSGFIFGEYGTHRQCLTCKKDIECEQNNF